MLESIDHINIVVDDPELMIRFYGAVLGLKLSKRVTITGQWIDDSVGLKDSVVDVVYLDAPSGPRLELLRYINPPGDRPLLLGVSNTPGVRHFAFRVSDIDQEVTRMKSARVKFFSDVQLVPDGQVAYAGGRRKRLVYFRDPGRQSAGALRV